VKSRFQNLASYHVSVFPANLYDQLRIRALPAEGISSIAMQVLAFVWVHCFSSTTGFLFTIVDN
jgi:hypothetical protein